jgi:hypothetical protein
MGRKSSTFGVPGFFGRRVMCILFINKYFAKEIYSLLININDKELELTASK